MLNALRAMKYKTLLFIIAIHIIKCQLTKQYYFNIVISLTKMCLRICLRDKIRKNKKYK